MLWLALLMLLPIGADLLMGVVGLPLPGAVVGFLLLLAWLGWRGTTPAELEGVSGGLVRGIPVFLVPPSIGMVAHLDILGNEWAAILAGVVAGTATTIAVTGLAASACLRRAERPATRQTADPAAETASLPRGRTR
ncbi:MAG: CidA/LrgA family protein [Acetobacteraceae bacterium]|nr:CidA/LrgA family protein [Acetobacteraceae bacterium]